MIRCPAYGLLITETQCNAGRYLLNLTSFCRGCKKEEILPVIIEKAPETIIKKSQLSPAIISSYAEQSDEPVDQAGETPALPKILRRKLPKGMSLAVARAMGLI